MQRSRFVGFTLEACSLGASLAFGDNAVLYWNQQVLDATRLSRNPPPIASRLLERYFGTDDLEFTATSDGLPGAVRTFKKLSDARREIGMSRVWAGIHVMADNLEGQKAGVKVADWVFENALQLLK